LLNSPTQLRATPAYDAQTAWDLLEAAPDAIVGVDREGRIALVNAQVEVLLNLPKKDGREVLAEVKSDPDLRVIPIIVQTTSALEADILRSYELHANSYVTKPVGFEALLDAVRGIEDFWLSLVCLPERRT
jgi:CheY-like chemotaxis protein